MIIHFNSAQTLFLSYYSSFTFSIAMSSYMCNLEVVPIRGMMPSYMRLR